MFAIISDGQILGHSEFEQGDPPMGVAFGRFIPAESFGAFIRAVPPDITDGDRVQIWNRLAARTSQGVVLQCAGVGIRYDLADETTCEVEVLGISSPPYEELFPHHIEAYERTVHP